MAGKSCNSTHREDTRNNKLSDIGFGQSGRVGAGWLGRWPDLARARQATEDSASDLRRVDSVAAAVATRLAGRG